jgi:PAS domain S-box-containing protein
VIHHDHAAGRRFHGETQHRFVALSSWDLDQCITSWNPAAELLFGYPADEVVGLSASILVPAGAHNPAKDLTERLQRGEHLGAVVLTRVRKSGEHIDVSLSLSPSKNEFGEFQGVSVISRALTDRLASWEDSTIAS